MDTLRLSSRQDVASGLKAPVMACSGCKVGSAVVVVASQYELLAIES